MQRIVVAGVPIDMQMEDTAFFEQRYAAYFAPVTEPAQMKIVSRTAEHIVPPEGKQLLKLRSTTVVELEDGKRCHFQYDAKRERYHQMCVYQPDFSDVDITLSIANDAPVLTTAEYEHAYTGFDFASRFAYLGGAVLHGSAIAYKGKGVIFSAPSGTGKSTHTGLWKRCFGDNVVFVNDDKPALRFDADGVQMYGTPWSGKTALNTNMSVPLHAVVFVQRGAENTLRRLDLTESIFHLQSQVIQPYHDATAGSMLIDKMILLTQRVPVYLMTCNMEETAALTARSVLFGE